MLLSSRFNRVEWQPTRVDLLNVMIFWNCIVMAIQTMKSASQAPVSWRKVLLTDVKALTPE